MLTVAAPLRAVHQDLAPSRCAQSPTLLRSAPSARSQRRALPYQPQTTRPIAHSHMYGRSRADSMRSRRAMHLRRCSWPAQRRRAALPPKRRGRTLATALSYPPAAMPRRRAPLDHRREPDSLQTAAAEHHLPARQRHATCLQLGAARQPLPSAVVYETARQYRIARCARRRLTPSAASTRHAFDVPPRRCVRRGQVYARPAASATGPSAARDRQYHQ